jgi:hypothetical protein
VALKAAPLCALVCLCAAALAWGVHLIKSTDGAHAAADAKTAVQSALQTVTQARGRPAAKESPGGRHIALAWDISHGKVLAALDEKGAQEQYFSPGSLMKVPVLFYLIASGRIEPDYTYTCTGRFYPRGESPVRDELIHEDVREPISGQWYKCSSLKGHGRVSPIGALAHSCNLFFLSLSGHITESVSLLLAFAEFCKRFRLLHAARQIAEAAKVEWSTRDRLHLVNGLPVRASVYEIAQCFALLLKEGVPDGGEKEPPFTESARAAKARQVIIEGMREASRTGTARALGQSLLAKTGSGLAGHGDIFALNGWCVSAWPAQLPAGAKPTGQDGTQPRIVFVSFVRESYGAGLPLEYTRHFWRTFLSAPPFF